MVVRTIGSHQGLSQRRPEIILKENLHFHPLIELHLSSRFCNTFFCDNLCCLPSERTAQPCCCYKGRGLCRQISHHTDLCNYTLSLSVFLFVLVFDLSILPVYIFSQELLDFVCVFVFVLACWSKNTFLQEDLSLSMILSLSLSLCEQVSLHQDLCKNTLSASIPELFARSGTVNCLAVFLSYFSLWIS